MLQDCRDYPVLQFSTTEVTVTLTYYFGIQVLFKEHGQKTKGKTSHLCFAGRDGA